MCWLPATLPGRECKQHSRNSAAFIGLRFTPLSAARATARMIPFAKTNLILTLKLDGKTILDEGDALDHYTQITFNPPIPLNSPPVDAIIYSQGIAILHAPLAAGKHVIRLDVKLPVPSFGVTFEYHNTFNITVKAGGH
jgi:hypothetical protein